MAQINQEVLTSALQAHGEDLAQTLNTALQQHLEETQQQQQNQGAGACLTDQTSCSFLLFFVEKDVIYSLLPIITE